MLRILSSLGLLGNLHETISNFYTAIKALFSNPYRHGFVLVGVFDNLYNFTRHTLYAISNAFTEIADSVFNGLNAIISHTTILKSIETKNDNEIDIEQEFLDNINSLAGVLDTNNKVWLNSFINDEIQEVAIDQNQVVHNQQADEEMRQNEEALEHINTKSNRQKMFDHLKSLKGASVRLKGVPLAVLYTLYQLIKKINRSVKMRKNQDDDQRIRNPRYFGYTKELEPYSYKKALAIKLFSIDDIIEIFTFEKSEVILTENRILCITQKELKEDLDYWTLQYSDILNVKVHY
jgi:hypothetical protein